MRRKFWHANEIIPQAPLDGGELSPPFGCPLRPIQRNLPILIRVVHSEMRYPKDQITEDGTQNAHANSRTIDLKFKTQIQSQESNMRMLIHAIQRPHFISNQ